VCRKKLALETRKKQVVGGCVLVAGEGAEGEKGWVEDGDLQAGKE